MLRRLAKKFPPIAWRDAKLAAYRAHIRDLHAEIRLRGGVVPPIDKGARPDVAPPPPRERAAVSAASSARIAESGLFDASWYRRQSGLDHHDQRDLIEHYLATGHQQGFSATPLLLESWYRAAWNVGGRAPLAHYLDPANRSNEVHPLFSSKAYLRQFPDAAAHRGGVLGHYLATGSDVPLAPPLLPPTEFVDRARTIAEELWRTRGTEHLPRQAATFDHDLAQRFRRHLRRDRSLLAERPLVSIVLPTFNRSGPMRAAIQSVLEQTYDEWELLIVDDASTDGTGAVIEEFAFDPRVRHFAHDTNKGVAAARNTALRHAEGTYVAYLDSDNTWVPDFLEMMVRHLQKEGARLAYSATALVEAGGKNRRSYRGMPYSREALRERNYIDCIAVVHERELLELSGPFDESLRRTVDWDLLIRLADITDFSYAPFIGSEYDPWEQTSGRITTTVPQGYRFRVLQRTLIDWDEVRSGSSALPDALSLVVVVTEPADFALEGVRRLLDESRTDVKIVVVDNHLPDHDAALLRDGLWGNPRVTHHRLSQPVPLEVARNVGASLATGRALIFVDESLWVWRGWDETLLGALDDHVAVQPLVLAQNGEVHTAGVSFAHGARPVHLFRGFGGDAPEVRTTRVVDAASQRCIAVRAEHFAAVEGFDPLVVGHLDGADLAVRLRAATGGTSACAAATTVAIRPPRRDAVPVNDAALARESARELANEQLLALAWRESGLVSKPPYEASGLGLIGHWRSPTNPWDLRAVLVHSTSDRPLRWAIKIGLRYARDRESWGDVHFARSLAASLEALGHSVTIDGRNAWYRDTSHLDDVVLVLQGRGRYLPDPLHTNVLWVFSHPEEAPIEDAAEFDLVFGASERWCRQAKVHAPTTETLMQCTDASRFMPVEPDPGLHHPLLFVGNARGPRPSVQAALEAGLVPAVYGRRWKGIVPDEAIRGEYFPNQDLHRLYASAGAVLNDHWDEMVEWGIISNRLFDLAASGATVISDRVAGIDDVFAGLVATYDGPADVRRLVDELGAEGDARRHARLALAERIRTEHSFDARAATLSERVAAVRESVRR